MKQFSLGQQHPIKQESLAPQDCLLRVGHPGRRPCRECIKHERVVVKERARK